MTRTTVTYLEYNSREIRYYIAFKATGEAFWMVKDFVKGFGYPSAKFIKVHQFRSGVEAACWAVTPIVLEQLEPVFANLEEVYEEECNGSWAAFLRRDEIIFGIKLPETQLRKKREQYQDAWERFQAEYTPEPHASARKQTYNTTSQSAAEKRRGEETRRKAEAEEAVRQEFERWKQQREDEENARREEQKRQAEERKRQTKQAEPFVRVELPKSPQEASALLGIVTPLCHLTKGSISGESIRVSSRAVCWGLF